MFLVVAEQIVQGKTVVTGDEVDAVNRQPAFVLVQVVTAAQPGCQLVDQPFIATHKTPDDVPIPAVPFGPAVTGKTADLVQSSGVPGLGNQLGFGQLLRKLDAPKQRRILQHLAALSSRQGAGQIETKAVDMHFPDPVFQAADNKVGHQRMIGVYGIAAAGIVVKNAFVEVVVMIKNIIAYAPEIDDRAVCTGLCGMVEDNVHNDAHACLMQRFDQIAKLMDMGSLFRGHAITRMRTEKTVGAVAPVVFQPQIGSVPGNILLIESHDRQQLNVRDTECLQVRDFFDQSGKRARIGHL